MGDVAVLSSSAVRHSCKVCRKGFPCGRSLGGHMRSHSLAEVETAVDDDDADDDGDKQQRRRGFDCVTSPGSRGYGLRENPKKTRRLSCIDDSGGGGGGGVDECGHHGSRGELRSPCAPSEVHHERRHGGMEVEPERGQEDALLIPTEPASGLMPAPRRRRRSMRVPAPAPPPAFDKEPEDVALCLIMLSRDILDRQCSMATGDAGYSPEEDSTRRDYHQYHHDTGSNDDASIAGTKIHKRKPNRSIAGDEKRGRYECTGCGRAFQSYQALGGHRASHKRINSNCSIAKAVADNHQPEPSATETNTSFSTASQETNYATDMVPTAVVALKARPHKTTMKFECPICFRVFGSGQALGGHKRSHTIAGELYERPHADGDAGVGDVEQPVVADGFLDLNLPAPGVED